VAGVLAGLPVTLAVLVLTMSVVSCEPPSFARAVTFVNETPKEVTIHEYSPGYSETPGFNIGPGQTRTMQTVVGSPVLGYRVTDNDGRVVFQVELSPKELEQMGWRIVIVDQSTNPTLFPTATSAAR